MLMSKSYRICGADKSTSTVRLSSLNKSQRKAAFKYYDEVWYPMMMECSLWHLEAKQTHRQEFCEAMVLVHGTKEKFIEFLKDVGYYGDSKVDR